MVEEKIIDIEESRHPIVEVMELDEPFIPNDILIDDTFFRATNGPKQVW